MNVQRAEEVHEPGGRLCLVKAAEGAAAQNLLLRVDFSVTPYIVQLKLKPWVPNWKCVYFVGVWCRSRNHFALFIVQISFLLLFSHLREVQRSLCRTFPAPENRPQRESAMNDVRFVAKFPAERRTCSVRTEHSAVVHTLPCCPHSGLAPFIP